MNNTKTEETQWMHEKLTVREAGELLNCLIKSSIAQYGKMNWETPLCKKLRRAIGESPEQRGILDWESGWRAGLKAGVHLVADWIESHQAAGALLAHPLEMICVDVVAVDKDEYYEKLEHLLGEEYAPLP